MALDMRYRAWEQAKLQREAGMRLFLQMHQYDKPERRRAAGGVICSLCRCEYRHHPYFDERTCFDGPIDHRLCNGDVVHL